MLKITDKFFLNNPLILAPLAGITNLPFRLIIKKTGCAMVCSEMISSNGLVYNSDKTYELLASSEKEKPLSIQIFGSNPEIMAQAAQIIVNHGADVLDINLGCSVRKVVKTGSGVALMREPELAKKILRAIRKAIDIPFTIKIRSGWDKSGEDALKIAKLAESCGVDAITLHPRTATQGFGGKADWSLISRVKKLVSIPVIGNGDIVHAEDAIKMRNETGCDGIMIGRAAIGNPWIFEQIFALMKKKPLPELSLEQRFEFMRIYLENSVKYLGEKRACRMMRSRLIWFSKGIPHSKKFREAIKYIKTKQEGNMLIDEFKNETEN
ncbi:tRNA-dihydrouridine synthase [Candidatus Magnetomoraceae bacterium gMMP-15]